jgi:hypothetical protein
MLPMFVGLTYVKKEKANGSQLSRCLWWKGQSFFSLPMFVA